MGLFNFKKKTGDQGGAPGVGDVGGPVKVVAAGPSTPWARAEAAYFDTYLKLNVQVQNWRMFAFLCLGIAAIGVGGAVYIGSKSKFIPELVEVDKLGRTVAVRAVTGDDAIADPQRLVYREMFDLIVDLRTVTTDVGANNRNMTNGFYRLSGAAANYAKAELRRNNPNVVGATKTVEVDVRSALPLSNKTWQVEWDEKSYGLNGEALGTEHWRATLSYVLSPGGSEEEIRLNPIGFHVTDLSWVKVI